MSNSELATRVSDGTPAPRSGVIRLVDAAPGWPLSVVRVDPQSASTLLLEGLGVGTDITVERRVALGGPLILRLGRTRLALARSVAGDILVAPADDAMVVGSET